ncbi:hypothetical protein ISCGN_015324 [Ixodes scapularis]
MDQTMVRMGTPANRTNNLACGSKLQIAHTGCARQGFTVALAARASGDKLPAFVILKEPTNAPCQGFEERLDDLGEIPRVATIWGPNIDDVQRLLVLDQAPIHKTQAAKDAIQERDTDLVYVPAGCTSLLQPADVFWNKPFKASLRRTWEAFIRKKEKTTKGNLRRPSRQDVLEFASEAWASVPEETVARSFRGGGIANALDRSEECDLHERLADIGTVVHENPDELRDESVDLNFGSDSEEPFDGFDSG